MENSRDPQIEVLDVEEAKKRLGDFSGPLAPIIKNALLGLSMDPKDLMQDIGKRSALMSTSLRLIRRQVLGVVGLTAALPTEAITARIEELHKAAKEKRPDADLMPEGYTFEKLAALMPGSAVEVIQNLDEAIEGLDSIAALAPDYKAIANEIMDSKRQFTDHMEREAAYQKERSGAASASD